MKRGRVPRFGAAQWTMTGWQKTMSPGSPVSCDRADEADSQELTWVSEAHSGCRF
jgi:hypothetical protein